MDIDDDDDDIESKYKYQKKATQLLRKRSDKKHQHQQRLWRRPYLDDNNLCFHTHNDGRIDQIIDR